MLGGGRGVAVAPPLSFGHFPRAAGETRPHVRAGRPRGIAATRRGRAPFVLRTFPPRAGATRPVRVGHTPAFASLRVPFRPAKGDSGRPRGIAATRWGRAHFVLLPRRSRSYSAWHISPAERRQPGPTSAPGDHEGSPLGVRGVIALPPLRPGHTPVFMCRSLGLRVPFRWAKGDGGAAMRVRRYEVGSRPLCPSDISPASGGNPARPRRAYPCVHVSVSWAPRPLSLGERGRWAAMRVRRYEVGSRPLCPSDISPAERGQPGLFGHFPRERGKPVRAGHTPAFASLRVPFRWAKGDGGVATRDCRYEVGSRPLCPSDISPASGGNPAPRPPRVATRDCRYETVGKSLSLSKGPQYPSPFQGGIRGGRRASGCSNADFIPTTVTTLGESLSQAAQRRCRLRSSRRCPNHRRGPIRTRSDHHLATTQKNCL